MMDFFRKSEGMWFSQRTVHHFDNTTDESGESNLIIQVVEPLDPRVNHVCALQGIDPSKARGGACFNWLATTSDREPNPDYAAVLIDVPEDDDPSRGRLVRDQGYVEGIPVVCRYWFGRDGILTIDTEYENNQGQERCWFVTDDFRIRIGTARMMHGINLISYCSERRCVSNSQLEQMIQQHQTSSTATV